MDPATANINLCAPTNPSTGSSADPVPGFEDKDAMPLGGELFGSD